MSRPRCKIAIDLGSCFSGYAYRIEKPLKEGKETARRRTYGATFGKTFVGRPWSDVLGSQYLKTPTTILYDEAFNVKEFGFRIANELGTRAEFYFENFKKSAKEDEVRT